MERRLGRGLGALLNSPLVDAADAATQAVRVELIQPNPYQPRKSFDPAALQELVESIRTHGVLQPVVLRPRGGGYELIAGERRWRAAQQAGLATIPAVLRPQTDDAQMLELALVENVQRRDLDPLEKAVGYQQMIERLGLTQEQVARRVSVERSTVANHIRLLELPEEAQASVRAGLLSMGHARALLGLRDPARIRATLRRIVREGLSVRQVEETVRAMQTESQRHPSIPAAKDPRPAWVADLETKLRTKLGSRVKIEPGPNWRGRIVLEYFDRAGLDRLVDGLLEKDIV